MFWRFNCLMVAGVSLTEDLREGLYQAARFLAQNGETAVPLMLDDCEGRLTTAFQTACLGSLAGIKFEAVLKTAAGTGNATFIIPEDALKDEDEEADFTWCAMPSSQRAASAAWLN